MDKFDVMPGLSAAVKDNLRQIAAVFGNQEGEMFAEEAPFDVIEEVDLGDMTSVKGEEFVVPPTSNVLFEVSKMSSRASNPEFAEKYGMVKSLSVHLKMLEGIQVNGTPEPKYKGKVFFLDLPYWVDTAHPEKKAEKFTGEKRAFLNPLKLFLKAFGYDLTSIKVNDQLCSELQGRQVRATITVKDKQKKTEQGTWVPTGEQQNRLTKFVAA